MKKKVSKEFQNTGKSCRVVVIDAKPQQNVFVIRFEFLTGF